MNKTITTIAIAASLIVGGVAGSLITEPVQGAPIVEAIDEQNVKVLQPVNFNIKETKAKLEDLQNQKIMTKNVCDADIGALTLKIEDVKAVILQAKTVGVE